MRAMAATQCVDLGGMEGLCTLAFPGASMTRSSSGTRYARACCRTQLSNQDARAPIATCFQPRRPCLGSIWITNVMRKHQSSHVIIKCSFAALASIRLVEEGTKERHSRLGRLAWLRITTRRRTSPSSQCSAVRAGKCGGTLVAEWQCDAATRSAIVPAGCHGLWRGSFTFKLGGAECLVDLRSHWGSLQTFLRCHLQLVKSTFGASHLVKSTSRSRFVRTFGSVLDTADTASGRN